MVGRLLYLFGWYKEKFAQALKNNHARNIMKKRKDLKPRLVSCKQTKNVPARAFIGNCSNLKSQNGR